MKNKNFNSIATHNIDHTDEQDDSLLNGTED
jgi:hypothetical protein